MKKQKKPAAAMGSVKKVLKLDDADWHIRGAKIDAKDKDSRHKAGAHIACFVYWLIDKDLINASSEEAKKAAKLAQGKRSKLKAEEFVDKYMSYKLFSSNVAPEIHDFVLAYYTTKVDPKRNSFFDDYVEIVCKDRDMYSFKPIMKDKKALAKVIDKRLAEYNKDPHVAYQKKQSLWPLIIIIAICVTIVVAFQKYEFELLLPKLNQQDTTLTN